MMQATAGHGRIATLLFQSSWHTRAVAHPLSPGRTGHEPARAPELPR
ncbi:hypothetical protein [Mesorhizobium shangrilense]|uniref:Uncharacterized protein n=1 Tax=Mesorhizobium shangrilense TaxID=460060 RepID=A0ABV2D625_9HYPH